MSNTIVSITEIKIVDDETLGPLISAKITYGDGQTSWMESQCGGLGTDASHAEQLAIGLERITAMAVRPLRKLNMNKSVGE